MKICNRCKGSIYTEYHICLDRRFCGDCKSEIEKGKQYCYLCLEKHKINKKYNIENVIKKSIEEFEKIMKIDFNNNEYRRWYGSNLFISALGCVLMARISSNGQLIKKQLKVSHNKNGYQKISFNYDNKKLNKYIHHLVWDTWIGIPLRCEDTIGFKNNNKNDIRYENLIAQSLKLNIQKYYEKKFD